MAGSKVRFNSRKRWIFFTAGRYFSAKRKTRGLAPSILSTAGIAVGVMTLMTVLAVMNGFQLSYIEDILEISSFHIRLGGSSSVDRQLMDNIKRSGMCVPFCLSLMNRPLCRVFIRTFTVHNQGCAGECRGT